MSDSDPHLNDPAEENKPSAAELEAAGQNAMFGDAPPAEQPKTSQAETPSAEVPSSDADPAQQPSAEAPPAETPSAETPSDAAQPYRVLARKYRPQTFSELIGQEPMVRTLGNAIERDRLAHAFLMTGVRGVGKTSTARLIAKALNCIGPDGSGGATIDPCGQCEPCTAIAEGRHIDVIEMDAASHTGVDDVREIIEAVRYAAVSARYKIYIIDEVHMLSRNAFNALLKTLEEPPAHVKFLFATTEVEKLPVTVLSRTQRFDLRRIPAELLRDHFAEICAKEGVEAEDEGLRIIAAAAEGSVRDGLSILDQAIAHSDLDSEGKVTAARVRDMLGLADKGAQRALLGMVLEGDAKGLLSALDDQYALGVEPLASMRALMDLVHRITVAQVGGAEADAPSAEEREQLTQWAGQVPAPQLHRLWQLLLKGHEEVRLAPDPLVSARMALLRVMHAHDLPDPGTLAKRLEALAKQPPAPASGSGASGASGPAAYGGTDAANAAGQGGAAPPSAQVPIQGWEQLVTATEQAGNHLAASIMRLQIRPLEIGQSKLRYSRSARYQDDIEGHVRDALQSATGERWQLEAVPENALEGAEKAALSLAEIEQSARDAAEAAMREHPMVKAAFTAFPEAEILDESALAALAPPKRRNRQ